MMMLPFFKRLSALLTDQILETVCIGGRNGRVLWIGTVSGLLISILKKLNLFNLVDK